LVVFANAHPRDAQYGIITDQQSLPICDHATFLLVLVRQDTVNNSTEVHPAGECTMVDSRAHDEVVLRRMATRLTDHFRSRIPRTAQRQSQSARYPP